MIVKSFLLKQNSISAIAALCDSQTIAVIRPEKQIEALFRDAIRVTIGEKKSAEAEFEAIRAYFLSLTTSENYRANVEKVLDALMGYLREGMYVQAASSAIEDYVMAKCARLCADAVYDAVGGTFIDGTELMICHAPKGKDAHFDWVASQAQIAARCSVAGPVVIAGGYGRLDSGYVVRVGKDGSHLMAALIGATLKAQSIEFYVEAPGINGIPVMTYDEAAHFCADAHAAFASSAIWPAKNAGIPIIVRDIQHVGVETVISSQAATDRSEAVICDTQLDLITVYGTGLLGRVGMSSSIFSCLAAEGVNVRFIAQTSSEYSISFAIRSKDKERTLRAIRGLFRENPLLPLDDVIVHNQEVGIVTVFGSKMRNVPGTSGRVFSTLGQAGISIIASAQGGEELSISLVLAAPDVEKAAALLK